ncbi:tRNA pseudouridine(55) synthase TruB [Desulfogranum japonicum]|uniref:tRNA pseudouridine(55) synthase TruB n=1 Tax=Desulfogranum japonicum TaxID=231447 RepID=UPI0003FD153F|nr:tRNA pseudouridine(55) synthase TruB [Desulfogranum japonicum]
MTAEVYLIDKPVGKSSFAMVRIIRRMLGIKKVGHAGTLDPFASGLLIICAGRPATKHIEKFMGGRKTYVATVELGVTTTTHDPEGEVTGRFTVPDLDRETIDSTLKQFVGRQLQAPPSFSAAKHKGKPLYHYARQGIFIAKEPKEIEIYALHCIQYVPPLMEIEVTCSRGTYVRVLGADIGKALGCGGAYLTALRRTVSGPFHVNDALCVDTLEGDAGKKILQEAGMSVDNALQQLPQEHIVIPDVA